MGGRSLAVALALIIVVAVCVVPVTPRAQPGAPLPGMMPGGVLLPAEMGSCCGGFHVGSWVEYSVFRIATRQLWHLHFAAVGREGSAWWIEMTMSEARRGEATVRMLMEEGEGGREDRVRRLIIQPEGQIPLELPVSEASAQLPQLDAGSGPAVFVGAEQLRLRPGTFATRHYRRGEGDAAHHIWLSEEVALWGLARYHSPTVRLTLVGQGRGAASRVTGEPVPFDPASLR
jgi:hypothetical protein